MADGQFQSTHPLRGATAGRNGVLPLEQFQSTHPLRGATRKRHDVHGEGEISIHAPLAGCDKSTGRSSGRRNVNFNPRTPCGVRPRRWKTTKKAKLFQSTHPLRGATSAFRTQQSSDFGFQSTHPLRGATDIIFDCMNCMKISIHAPLAGCDSLNFEKTELEKISIHAPLAGCDCPHRIYAHRSCHFNPRTPCGVRLLRTVYLD